MMSILFYGSNIWYASKTIVRQMERLQRKSLKWIQSNSHFTDKEYNDCLRSVNLLSIRYQFVFLDLLVLNRILTRKLPLETEKFWQIRKGHPKTRLKEKIFLFSTECNRQRCRPNFFYRVTNFNNSMSLARDFPTITRIQVLPNSKENSKNIYLIQLRRILITNHTHMDGQCFREIKFKPL